MLGTMLLSDRDLVELALANAKLFAHAGLIDRARGLIAQARNIAGDDATLERMIDRAHAQIG